MFQISNLSENLFSIELEEFYYGNIVKFPKNLKKIKLHKDFIFDFTYIHESDEIIKLYSEYKYIDFLIHKFSNIKLTIN